MTLPAATTAWTALALGLLAVLAVFGAVAGLMWRWHRSRLDAAQSQLDDLRQRDALSGLPGRAAFEATLDDAALACDGSRTTLAVLCVGLDGFRQINDAYGHAAGDAVIVQTAHRLQQFAGGTQHAARLAGNEFVLLLGAGHAAPADAAAALLRALQKPYAVDGQPELRVDASIGVAVYPDHGSRPRLIGNATLAMRSVKLVGGGGLALYDPAMAVDHREQIDLLQDLRHALERGQLQLFYQPKVDARTLQITAAEALLRWQHPKRGTVLPTVFIPLAERHGLIVPIGRWVIEEACRQSALWRQKGLRMRVAVNISGHQMRQPDLVQHIQAQLRRHGIPPGRMTCEITETVAMEDTLQTRAAFERLRRAGLHVSIDDFGTGHSSLASLRRLPAAEIKIDRAFVHDLGSGGDHARSIVATIVQLARALSLRVVAEGVETEAQRDALVALGADELQGYLFARPMTATALALWAQGDDDSGSGAHAGFRESLFTPTAPASFE